jgi:hypothetical protein
MRQYTKEGDLTMSLVRFTAPADSKGTALLTHETKAGEESRWLYLSELRQVKQIAGSSKSTSFKGSELAYEDLAVDTLDKYDYKLLGSAKAGGRECWHVERTARFPDSGYGKSAACFDKEHGYLLEVAYQDKAGEKLKQARFGGYQQVKGKWRPAVMEMVNLQTKKKTVLKSGNYQLGVDLPGDLFTTGQLQKQ